MQESYDTVIIGAGSAGMAAAIYAARFNLKVLVLGEVVGGLLNESHNVENYPGYASISGLDLMMKFKEHMDNLKVPVRNEWVTSVKILHDGEPKRRAFEVKTGEATYHARTLILAMGAKHKKLDAKNEEHLAGKGVSYCATCDAAFYRDIPVCIVGGGDSAALAANLVKEFASKVYVIVRKDQMRAEPINRRRLEESDKIEIIYNAQVEEILGKDGVEGVRLSREHRGSQVLAVQGVFVEIGQVIQSELAAQIGVARNGRQEIIIDAKSQTNVPGVYAAGDVANREYKQALTGAAEGAVAAFGAYAFIQCLDEQRDVEVGY